MGTGLRLLPAAKLGLEKWLQVRRKARRVWRKAPPRIGVPPSFLSEAFRCQKSLQGTARRLTPGTWNWDSRSLGVRATSAVEVGSCWVERRGEGRQAWCTRSWRPARPPSPEPLLQTSFERDRAIVIQAELEASCLKRERGGKETWRC